MIAHTLFSDTQPQLVARVLNNSCEDKVLATDTFLSMAEPVQCLLDGCHKPASPLAKGDQSQYDTLFLGESASLAPPCSPSSQMPVSETALRALSVSTADEVTASSSSTPSSEGTQDHIEGLLQCLPDDLTLDQKQRAENFIRSRANVFSRSEFDIGRTNLIPHRINTGDHSPHFEQLRHHPTTHLPVIDEHVQHMLEHDVVEPAASPWCSNVVMVRKQDGTMRLCIHYRKLNGLTVKDKFLLPKIDTCLDALNGCKFFSTCDLRWGYWQTEMDERDRDKTAFVTRKGQWRFKVLVLALPMLPASSCAS